MSSSSRNDGQTVDIRLYLCALVSGMVLAFGAGVFFGPTPTFEPLPSSMMTASDVSPLAISERVDSKQILSQRRHPATHSAELGKIKQVHVNVGQAPSFEELDGAVLDRRNFSAVSLDAKGSPQEEHEPAGQHLLVDIKNVNAEFLNSEEQLAKAMVEVVTEAKLTLLSYHCHSLEPAGVSCVGVLLESHISFHTWPVAPITSCRWCPRLRSCLEFRGRIPLSLLGPCGLMSSEDSDPTKRERHTI
jgi:hypothetical protein